MNPHPLWTVRLRRSKKFCSRLLLNRCGVCESNGWGRKKRRIRRVNELWGPIVFGLNDLWERLLKFSHFAIKITSGQFFSIFNNLYLCSIFEVMGTMWDRETTMYFWRCERDCNAQTNFFPSPWNTNLPCFSWKLLYFSICVYLDK